MHVLKPKPEFRHQPLQAIQIVLWLSVLTEHQVHTFRALQDLLGLPIHFVVGLRTLADRTTQGWCEPEVGDLSVETLPKRGWWRTGCRVLERYPHAIHIFGGFWADRRFFPLLLLAQRRSISTALMMESFVELAQSYFRAQPGPIDSLKSVLRPLAYNLAGRLVARRLHAAFPISGKAIEQIKAMGTPVDRIYPFGYFVPSISAGNPDHAPKSKALSLVFVGSLIARKGLPTLIEAVKRLRIEGHDIELDVYGPGDASLLESIGVHYRGVIPFGQAQKVIRAYDLLVLPSLHDGWGVVVNEALLQGVPALVSNACGAKTLVEVSGAGSIFEAGSVEDLMRVLRELCDPARLADCQRNARTYGPQLNPVLAANQLHLCLLSAADPQIAVPLSPWYP
jgi:glycosyltransferase involved in cell wall biosynthesis